MDIAAVIKQQMLGVLIDALGKAQAPGGANLRLSPGSIPLPAEALSLKAGEMLSATVAQTRPDGRLALSIRGQPVEASVDGADLPAPARQNGSTILLRVAEGGATPRLAFVGMADEAPATRAASPAPQTATPQAQVPQAARLAALPTLARLTAEAAARQASAAPLYADLAALDTKALAALPRPVAAVATALLALRLDGEKPVTPEALKQVLTATTATSLPANRGAAPAPPDAKALLVLLREFARPAQTPADPGRPDAEPPRRDAMPAALRPQLSALAGETDPKIIGAALARGADQASERLTLHQLATAPDVRPQMDNVRTTLLSGELPVAIGAQTAMAGFKIEREPRRRAASGSSVDVWGVRFAIDADVIGPVHAHVRLAGATVSVSLWAEDRHTHGLFSATLPLLEAALAENALDIGEIRLFSGRPAGDRNAASGQLLDRVS